MNKLEEIIKKEEKRQRETLMLIPSENYVSKEVKRAVGSVFSNKYSEGYPGRRYYQGNRFVDELERLAVEKAKNLFKVESVNVQPYSGSPANAAVLFALCDFGDKIMGLKLSSGGHLTHGHPEITFSGKYFKSIQFGLDKKGLLDYGEIERLAERNRPKVIFVGTTSYPLAFNWRKFSEIADKFGAYLVADISHVAGLVISGVYPDPSSWVHLITTTTHKTLRGPRGAMIMVTKKGIGKNPELPSQIDKAVFPGLQGGPHNNTTAGILQALIEVEKPDFKEYGGNIVKNAKALSDHLLKGGLNLFGGGTECHLLVVDLREKNLSGNIVSEALEAAGIVVNKNSVPDDPMPPFYPSGIRLGTPGVTTRGLGEKEMKKIAEWILRVIDHVGDEKLPLLPEKRSEFLKSYRSKAQNDGFLKEISDEVKLFLEKYPVP